MKRIVVLLLVASLMAVACAAPRGARTGSDVPHCATLEAQALISPNAPVHGAFDCLAPEFAQSAGMTSDADIQAIAAQEPVYTSYRYAGHTAAGYYFEFSDASTVAGCFRFHIDTHGHVDKVGSKVGACPRPLP
jgi:hypothetical protein